MSKLAPEQLMKQNLNKKESLDCQKTKTLESCKLEKNANLTCF